MLEKIKPAKSAEWESDPRAPGIRLNLITGHWYLNQRVGKRMLSEKTPFTTNQKNAAKDYRLRRMVEEKARQKAVQMVGQRSDDDLAPAPVPEFSTWGDVLNVWEFRLAHDYSICALTRENRQHWIKGIRKVWLATHLHKIDDELITDEKFYDKLLRFHATFAQTYCPEYVNKARVVFCDLYEILIERNVVTKNLAEKLPFLPSKPKTFKAPCQAEIAKLLQVLRSHCPDTADLCEGLVYTGLRRKEAELLRKEHVVLNGTHPHLDVPAEIVKNKRRRRIIPLQGEAVPLFTRLVAASDAREGRVFKVVRCRNRLIRACKVVGIPPLTHHKLRHLFTTFAYEQTANAALVSKWLGHGDGGILVLKTYNHLRADFELEKAAKLSFGLRPV